MKYAIIKIILVLFIFAFAISCDNGVNPINVENKIDTLHSTTHFLWPSKVGNYWDFKTYDFRNYYNRDSSWIYEGFSSFGIDLDTIQSEPSLSRREIVDSIFINIDDTVYSCHIFDGYNPITEKYRNLKFPYWIGNSGIYSMGIYVEGSDSVFNKGLYIPTEIPLNSNWDGQIAYRIDGYFLETSTVVERKCLSKTEIIKTPMGEFECYVIFTRIWMADDIAGYYDYYKYYSLEVGLVCTIRLSVMPEVPFDGAIHWWLDYMSIIYNYSIN